MGSRRRNRTNAPRADCALGMSELRQYGRDSRMSVNPKPDELPATRHGCTCNKCHWCTWERDPVAAIKLLLRGEISKAERHEDSAAKSHNFYRAEYFKGMAEESQQLLRWIEDMEKAGADGPAKIVNALQSFSDKLASGSPIAATRVERHDTPDGPMHTRTGVDLIAEVTAPYEPFKAGDWVMCVNASGTFLESGVLYQVVGIAGCAVRLHVGMALYTSDRFRRATPVEVDAHLKPKGTDGN